MADTLSDQKIAELVAEKKRLPEGYREKMRVRPKTGHKERELDLKGENGSELRLILRQSLLNPLDFSVILAYRMPQSNQLFRLRRYNGKSHEHTNPIEKETFFDFHVHKATERYQQSGAREDTYAEPSEEFANFQEAIECLLRDCGFEAPYNPQTGLFEEIRKP